MLWCHRIDRPQTGDIEWNVAGCEMNEIKRERVGTRGSFSHRNETSRKATVHAHELAIPPAAETDENARELVRVWAASGKQHVAIATGLWRDPAAWGIMLVDLARHLARAYELSEELDSGDVLARIRQGMDAEWTRGIDPHRLGDLYSRARDGRPNS